MMAENEGVLTSVNSDVHNVFDFDNLLAALQQHSTRCCRMDYSRMV